MRYTFYICSGQDLNGNTVGIAFIDTVCDDRASVGIVQDGGRNLASVGVTAAHELGHLLNMRHDDSRMYENITIQAVAQLIYNNSLSQRPVVVLTVQAGASWHQASAVHR